MECWVPAGRVSRTPRGPGFRKPPCQTCFRLFRFRCSFSVIQFLLSSFRYTVSVIQFPSSSSTIQIQSFTSGQCTILLSFSLRYPESVVQFPLFSIRISVSLFDSVILIQLLDFHFSELSFGTRSSSLSSVVRPGPACRLLPISLLVLLGSLPAIVRIRHGKMFRYCFSGMWSLSSSHGLGPCTGPGFFFSLLGHGDPQV